MTNGRQKIHNKDMETEILANAYAKINLLLDVVCRRPDGYHELDGVMQSISLRDSVYLKKAEGLAFESNFPLPENNTCVKAARAFLGGSGHGVSLRLEKRIPSEAGLGGASADAAAVLRGLNRLYAGTELERTEAELFSLGLSVGADVPFCLAGGCARAGGVGERLAPVKGLDLPLLIVKSDRGVSTGGLFSSLGVGREKTTRISPNAVENALAAIENGDESALAACLENALQPAASKAVPEINEYAERLVKAGALGASMTGSGAAVFGIFPSDDAAKAALPAFSDCAFASFVKALPSPAPCVINFRKAAVDDAPLTARLKREAWLTTYRGIYPDELIDGFDLEERAGRARMMLSSPTVTGFIIEADGTPCGFMMLNEAEGVFISALYLLKEYRGFGIGAHAFRLIRERCRERGLHRFECSCNAHNAPALGFYARMGGREISRSMGHENKREDQIRLEFGV